MVAPRKPVCQRPDVFWGEISPCEHVLEIYGNDEVFLDSLEGFIGAGLAQGEAVIMIATSAHREGIMTRLRARGLDVAAAVESDQLIALDAEETLSLFMVNSWPDEVRFQHVVSQLIARARAGNRRVRAFGEMVAILWARGHGGATVHLEFLWNRFMRSDAFSLFCAYPKSGFTEGARSSLAQICNAHSRVIQNG